MVEAATKFLSDPRVRRTSIEEQHKFLRSKGVTDDELQAAMDQLRLSSSTTTDYAIPTTVVTDTTTTPHRPAAPFFHSIDSPVIAHQHSAVHWWWWFFGPVRSAVTLGTLAYLTWRAFVAFFHPGLTVADDSSSNYNDGNGFLWRIRRWLMRFLFGGTSVGWALPVHHTTANNNNKTDINSKNLVVIGSDKVINSSNRRDSPHLRSSSSRTQKQLDLDSSTGFSGAAINECGGDNFNNHTGDGGSDTGSRLPMLSLSSSEFRPLLEAIFRLVDQCSRTNQALLAQFSSGNHHWKNNENINEEQSAAPSIVDRSLQQQKNNANTREVQKTLTNREKEASLGMNFQNSFNKTNSCCSPSQKRMNNGMIITENSDSKGDESQCKEGEKSSSNNTTTNEEHGQQSNKSQPPNLPLVAPLPGAPVVQIPDWQLNHHQQQHERLQRHNVPCSSLSLYHHLVILFLCPQIRRAFRSRLSEERQDRQRRYHRPHCQH